MMPVLSLPSDCRVCKAGRASPLSDACATHVLELSALFCGGWESVDPAIEVSLQLTGLFLGDDAATDGDAGLVNRVGIARYERVPPIEVPAFVDQAVTAGGRQPFDR